MVGITCIVKSLALLTLFQTKVTKCYTEEASYVKVRVPESYIRPHNGKDEKSYGTKNDCSFGCTLVGGEECTAFYFQKGECVLATINKTFPYISNYLTDGINVMVRKERVLLNAKTIPHLGTLAGSESDKALTNSSSGFGPVLSSQSGQGAQMAYMAMPFTRVGYWCVGRQGNAGTGRFTLAPGKRCQGHYPMFTFMVPLLSQEIQCG